MCCFVLFLGSVFRGTEQELLEQLAGHTGNRGVVASGGGGRSLEVYAGQESRLFWRICGLIKHRK